MEADLQARPLAAAAAVTFDDGGHLLIVEPAPASELPTPGMIAVRGT